MANSKIITFDELVADDYDMIQPFLMGDTEGPFEVIIATKGCFETPKDYLAQYGDLDDAVTIEMLYDAVPWNMREDPDLQSWVWDHKSNLKTVMVPVCVGYKVIDVDGHEEVEYVLPDGNRGHVK